MGSAWLARPHSRLAPQCDVDLLPHTAAQDRELQRLAWTIVQRAAQAVGSVDRAARDLDDHIADEDACGRCGATILDVRDDCAVVDGICPDAEVTAAHAAVLLELADHTAKSE